jgi:hypothetical protein
LVKLTQLLSPTSRAPCLSLSLSSAKRRGLAAAARGLGSVRVVNDNRGWRAAKRIRDGHGQVQKVKYSFSSGYW